MSWGETVEIRLGDHWDSRSWELYDEAGELAGFMKSVSKGVKKAARPLVKVHQAHWKPTKKVLKHVPGFKGVYKFYKKNWKWIAVAVAVVITIYSMGAASPILAYLKAGMVACKAAAVTAGKAVVGMFTAGGGSCRGRGSSHDRNHRSQHRRGRGDSSPQRMPSWLQRQHRNSSPGRSAAN